MDGKPTIITNKVLNKSKRKNISNINNGTKNPYGCISLLATDNERTQPKVFIEKGLENFKEMFVWCPKHSHYICSCRGQVFDLKNNLVLQNPNTDAMAQNVSLLHFINLEEHSARTNGSIINYRVRNSCRIFTVKRDYEIKKCILSNSNSIFRIDPLQSQSSQSEASTTNELISMKTANTNKCKLETNNHSCSNEAIADRTTKALPTPLNPKIQLIYHNSDSSDEEVIDSSSLPRYGLLCLNGYGFLPVKEYDSKKLVFQHPVIKNVFVYKKDQNEASKWLNDLLKGFMSSDLQHTLQKWVVVQRGVLKISKPFDINNLKTDKKFPN